MHLVKQRPIGYFILLFAGLLGIGAIHQLETGRYIEQALTWRLLGDQNTPTARHENAYVEVGGFFYLMGGRGTKRVERYDPSDSTWSNRSFPPIDMHHFQPVAISGTVYVVSAYTGTFPDEPTVDDVYKYIPASDQWLVGSSIPASRRRGSAGVAVYNGKIYVVGGSTGGHGGSSVRKNLFDEYDPVADSWTTLPNAPFARDHVHAVVVGNKLYVTGGRNGGNGDNVEEVDVYNFSTGQWATLSSPASDLPTPRAGAASVAVGNYVVVIGGESSQDLAHNEVEALNTLNNTWVTMNDLVVGRHGSAAIFYNDNIYITAGAGNKGGTPELNSHEILETNGQSNLPVELAPGFAARTDGQRVVLTWRTLSETNNAGFEVQRKTGSTFESIGFVQGAGTVLSPRAYSFTASDLSPGRHVFRLKQVDFDGRFEYSPEVFSVIDLDGSFHLGNVYPNPLNPQANFTLAVARMQRVNIQVYDMLGRSIAQVFDGVLSPQEPNVFSIRSENWAGGKYQLVARGEYFTATRGFTVLK